MKWRRALLPASRDEISLTGASQNLVRPEFLRKSRRPRLPEGHGGYRGRGGVGGDQLSQYRQPVPRVDVSVRVRFCAITSRSTSAITSAILANRISWKEGEER